MRQRRQMKVKYTDKYAGVEEDDLSEEDCPEVEQDEEKDDYLDRCSEDILDQYEGTGVTTADAMEVCEIAWEGRSAKPAKIKHKTHAAPVEGMVFVMSDETPDRMDDIIMSDGWDLQHFNKNPIALFNHKSDFPIGKWKNLRVDNKQSSKGELSGVEARPAH